MVFKKGQSGNPKGRPQGQTLKEYARQWIMTLPDEEKKKKLDELPFEIVWKMSEGNPHSTSDLMSGGEKIAFNIFNTKKEK